MARTDGGPVRHIADGVVWYHGDPHPVAVVNLTPGGCLFAGADNRRRRRGLIESLARAFPAGQIISVSSPVSADRLVAAQRAGSVDDAYRAWCELAAADERWERTYWLSVPVETPETVVGMVRRWTAEQWSRSRGVPGQAPTKGEQRDATGAARRLPGRLGALAARPASAAEVEWLAARRYDPSLPRPTAPVGTVNATTRRRVSMWADTVLDTDPAHRAVWIRRPRGADTAVATVVVTGSPAEEFDPDPSASPDSAVLRRAEQCQPGTWPLDTCLRWWTNPADETTLNWRARGVKHQVAQGDELDAAGADAGARRASTEIDDLRDRLARREGPQLRTLTTVTVWADTPPESDDDDGGVGRSSSDRALDTVAERLDHVVDVVGGGWDLTRPPNDQLQLLDLQLPGVRVPAGLVAWSDHVLPAMVAAAAPAGLDVCGDEEGYLLGTLTGDTTAPAFLWDPTRAPQSDVNANANVLVVGESGAGKSTFGKTAVLAHTARLGGTVVVDPSPNGEWGIVGDAARKLGWSAQVVRPDRGGLSIDPLRVLSGEAAVDGGTKTVCSLGGVVAGSEEAAAVREAVERQEARGGSLSAVLEDLQTSPDVASQAVGRRVAALARHYHARTLFDPDLPPVDSTARLVVIALNDLVLPDGKGAPSEDELIGQAVVTASLAYARHWAFTRPEFTLLVVEEFGALQQSPWIVDLLDRIQKLARKFDAGVLTIAQAASEVPAKIAAGCRQVAMFRTAHLDSEVEAAATLLRRPGDPLVKEALPGLANGRFLFLDLDERVAVVQGARPPIPELRDATDTSRPRPVYEGDQAA